MENSLLHDSVRAVHQLFMITSDRIADDLSSLGLSHATATALWAIDPAEPGPSMKMLAKRLFCHAPNLSFVIGQLETRGLVERRIDDTDRRSRTVALTPEGVRVRAEVVRTTLAATPLAALDQAQLRDLSALLEPVLRRLADVQAAGATGGIGTGESASAIPR